MNSDYKQGIVERIERFKNEYYHKPSNGLRITLKALEEELEGLK